MGNARFSDAFLRDAVHQMTDRGLLKALLSRRAQEDERQAKLVKDAW